MPEHFDFALFTAKDPARRKETVAIRKCPEGTMGLVRGLMTPQSVDKAFFLASTTGLPVGSGFQSFYLETLCQRLFPNQEGSGFQRC